MSADELTGTAQADRFRVAVLAGAWSQILMLASSLPDVSPLMNLIQKDPPGTAAVGLLAVVFGQQVMGYSHLLGFGQREPERPASPFERDHGLSKTQKHVHLEIQAFCVICDS